MSGVINHVKKNPIPKGYRIFEDRVGVAGCNHRHDNAVGFATREYGRLELEPEPSNPHDEAAIRVVGRAKGIFFEKRRFVGYVPADVAARVKRFGGADRLVPRLTRCYVSRNDYVEIWFQLLGRREDYDEWSRIEGREETA